MEPDVATGETSRKKSNQDDTERPLKKAKYLWQVKGKYHLKDNQTSNNNNNHNNNNNIAEKTIDEQMKNDSSSPSNKTQTSCIEALIANSDKYMEFSLLDKNIDKSISDEIPITLVKQSPQTDDFYLRKWQARQIAKGFLDNTINRVLEHWMVAPFDAGDLVENCDSGGQVEDEGILMAIQSHGLQSGVRPSLFHCNTRVANWEAQQNCTCTSKSSTVQADDAAASLMPFHQRDEPDLNDFCYYEDKPPPLTSPLTATTTTTTTTNKIQVEAVEMPMLIDDDNDGDDNEETLKINDTDFLDAAVAVAIQKKGLTSLNCVDCG